MSRRLRIASKSTIDCGGAMERCLISRRVFLFNLQNLASASATRERLHPSASSLAHVCSQSPSRHLLQSLFFSFQARAAGVPIECYAPAGNQVTAAVALGLYTIRLTPTEAFSLILSTGCIRFFFFFLVRDSRSPCEMVWRSRLRDNRSAGEKKKGA